MTYKYDCAYARNQQMRHFIEYDTNEQCIDHVERLSHRVYNDQQRYDVRVDAYTDEIHVYVNNRFVASYQAM
jgi:hypothetical protein